MTSWWDRN